MKTWADVQDAVGIATFVAVTPALIMTWVRVHALRYGQHARGESAEKMVGRKRWPDADDLARQEWREAHRFVPAVDLPSPRSAEHDAEAISA